MLYKKIVKNIFMLVILLLLLFTYEYTVTPIITRLYHDLFLFKTMLNLLDFTFGIFLGLFINNEYLFNEKRKHGRWSFSYKKFIYFSMPMIMMALLGILLSEYKYRYFQYPLINQTNIIFCFTFSSVLIKCFNKNHKEQNIDNKKINTIYLINYVLIVSFVLLFFFFDYILLKGEFNISSFIIFTIIGIVVGDLDFLDELSKKGKLQLDFYRFVILGVPNLFFIFFSYMYENFPAGYMLAFISSINSDLYLVLSMLFGYILITSIKNE